MIKISWPQRDLQFSCFKPNCAQWHKIFFCVNWSIDCYYAARIFIRYSRMFFADMSKHVYNTVSFEFQGAIWHLAMSFVRIVKQIDRRRVLIFRGVLLVQFSNLMWMLKKSNQKLRIASNVWKISNYRFVISQIYKADFGHLSMEEIIQALEPSMIVIHKMFVHFRNNFPRMICVQTMQILADFAVQAEINLLTLA